MSIRFYLPGAEDAFLRPLQKREAPPDIPRQEKIPLPPGSPEEIQAAGNWGVRATREAPSSLHLNSFTASLMEEGMRGAFHPLLPALYALLLLLDPRHGKALQ